MSNVDDIDSHPNVGVSATFETLTSFSPRSLENATNLKIATVNEHYLRRPINLRHWLLYQCGLRSAYTHTSDAERDCLKRHAAGKCRVVEIGVFQGANTRMFRDSITKDGVVIAVDPYWRRCCGVLGFGWVRRIAHAEVAQSKRGNVLWVESLGCDAPSVPGVQAHLPVDMIFIDGDHSWEGIEGDWEAWKCHVAPGGIVAIHDSIGCPPPTPGSEQFTQQVIMADDEFEFVEAVDTLTIMRKRSDA